MTITPGTIAGTVTSPVDLPAGAPLNPATAPASMAIGGGSAQPGNAGTVVIYKKPQPILPMVLKDLDPDTLGGYLIAYETGLYRYVARVWRRMRKQDSHLLSVSTKRYVHVARLDWEITPNDSTPEARAQAEFLSDFFAELRVWDPGLEGGAAGLRRGLRHLMGALAYGYAGCEIVWRPGAGQDGSLRADLIKVPPEYFDCTGGVWKYYADWASQAAPLIPDKFVLHRADESLMVAGSILWLLKYTCLSAWSTYTDKFGTPGLVGEAPAGANEASVEKLQSMLENWAQNLAAVLPAGYKANVVDGKGQGTSPHQILADWCDAAQSVLWLGGDLTTQSASGTGTLAGSAHKENEQELTEDDAGDLGETLDEQLAAPAVKFQFGQPLLAHFHLKVAKAVDLIAAIGVDTALINTFNLQISEADVRAKYGWREPDPGEKVIVPNAPPSMGAVGLSPTSVARSADSGVDGTAMKGSLGEDTLARAYELILAPMRAAIAEATSVEDLKSRLAKIKTNAGPFAAALEPLLEQALRAGWASWLTKTSARGGTG